MFVFLLSAMVFCKQSFVHNGFDVRGYLVRCRGLPGVGALVCLREVVSWVGVVRLKGREGRGRV